jgi:hypothetical protein
MLSGETTSLPSPANSAGKARAAQGVSTGDMRLTSPSPDMTMALVALSALSTNLPSMSQ